VSFLEDEVLKILTNENYKKIVTVNKIIDAKTIVLAMERLEECLGYG
jgi:hypothetical protein